jgi:hypothetical protein
MNTKIITALVIAFALVGLTGAASAQGSYYTGNVNYDFTQILDTEEPTAIDVDSGACFDVVIDHFDTNYGFPNPDAPVIVGGGVGNTMYAMPGLYSTGVEHQMAAQSGSAGVTIRSPNVGDGLPELEAEITSAQSMWYSGSFDEYMFMVSDVGTAGAYGLHANGLDFGDPGPLDDCGNCGLISTSWGIGSTYGDFETGAKLMEGTFSVSEFERMTVDLEGVPRGEAAITVEGGAAGASTFVGTVPVTEVAGSGGMSTTISVGNNLLVGAGWDYDLLPVCP